jgi:tRNA pseudouridine55 synthase
VTAPLPQEKNLTGDLRFPQSGALLVDKPVDLTTNDVVYRTRKALSAGKRLPWGFKIGHGGTLDPFATGVTVIFYGEATKLANAYLRSSKIYSGLMQLGQQTDTADHTGSMVAEALVPTITLEDWRALAREFTSSEYLQTPPMYSAKKVKGQALHHIARQGREIEREAIAKQITRFDLEAVPGRADQLRFIVNCESGTYVRTLAEDLAKRAGTHAHLRELRRESSSDCSLRDCVSLEEAVALLSSDQDPSLFRFVRSTSQLATHLAARTLAPDGEAALRRGLSKKFGLEIDQFNEQFPDAEYGLLRAADQFPVGLIHKGKLQRVINR